MSFNRNSRSYSNKNWDIIPAKVFKEYDGSRQPVRQNYSHHYSQEPHSSNYRASWHIPPPPSRHIPPPPQRFERRQVYYAAGLNSNNFSIPSRAIWDYDDFEPRFSNGYSRGPYDVHYDELPSRTFVPNLNFKHLIDPKPRENIAFPLSKPFANSDLNFPPSTGFTYRGTLPSNLSYLQEMSISAGYYGVLNTQQTKPILLSKKAQKIQKLNERKEKKRIKNKLKKEKKKLKSEEESAQKISIETLKEDEINVIKSDPKDMKNENEEGTDDDEEKLVTIEDDDDDIIIIDEETEEPILNNNLSDHNTSVPSQATYNEFPPIHKSPIDFHHLIEFYKSSRRGEFCNSIETCIKCATFGHWTKNCKNGQTEMVTNNIEKILNMLKGKLDGISLKLKVLKVENQAQIPLFAQDVTKEDEENFIKELNRLYSALENQWTSALRLCTLCGKPGHIAKKCRTDLNMKKKKFGGRKLRKGRKNRAS